MSTARFKRSPGAAANQYDCPTCGAKAGSSCLSLQSWAPEAGIFTRRQRKPHPKRVALVPPPVKLVLSERGVLRARLAVLVHRKLAGQERKDANWWISAAARTVDELRARAAELEQLADLP